MLGSATRVNTCNWVIGAHCPRWKSIALDSNARSWLCEFEICRKFGTMIHGQPAQHMIGPSPTRTTSRAHRMEWTRTCDGRGVQATRCCPSVSALRLALYDTLKAQSVAAWKQAYMPSRSRGFFQKHTSFLSIARQDNARSEASAQH